MALSKVTYTDGLNIITADNLNDIQDEIIANAASITAEATARASAVSAEATARANADALKQNDVCLSIVDGQVNITYTEE